MPIVAFLLSVWQHSPMPSTKAPSVEPENGPICTCRWLPCAWNPSLGQVVARIPVAGCTEHDPRPASPFGPAWGTPGADPLGDIRKMARFYEEQSGYAPNVIGHS